MFSISSKSFSGFNIFVLSDDSNGTYLEIIPECGAILRSFNILIGKIPFNVVKSYNSREDFDNNVESLGFLGCKLSPFVCRLKNGKYRFGKRDYTIAKYYLGDNALHGLLYDRSFEVIQQNSDENSSSIKMVYRYRADDSGYPFNYDCIVTYELEKNNLVNVITESVNHDKGLIPIQDGWHPYFTLGDQIDNLQLEFQSNEIVVFDNNLIPTGELKKYDEFCNIRTIGDTVLDNCFSLNFAECQPMCVLRNPLKNLELGIYPDKSYPYLQIYTPPHRESIAIENISSAPDAFNNNLGTRVLGRDESAIFKTSYKISLLS